MDLGSRPLTRSTRFNVQFRRYERNFVRPLQTSYGSWATRDGLIIRLRDPSGRMGWGEVAPIPWFGTETLEQAIAFLRSLDGEISPEQLWQIPDSLPCCQFAFESAVNALTSDREPEPITFAPSTVATLLPAGDRVLQTWQTAWQAGHRTFKWKIGVLPSRTEWGLFAQLLGQLPTEGRLRLDANGALTAEDCRGWLERCDAAGDRVEFLEQPLNSVAEMQAIAPSFRTPIALDESVTQFKHLQACIQGGWRGVFVLKPAIAGFPSRLKATIQARRLDCVFSSVFESFVGQTAALQLAAAVTLIAPSHPARALGFGVGAWLDPLPPRWLETLWNRRF